MCGRYALEGPLSRISEFFQAGVHEDTEFTSSWNIAPTASVPVVRVNRAGERVIINHRWGLIPHWAGEEGISLNLYNARGETIAEKPAFRTSFRRTRCLIPASGYYEWQTPLHAGTTRKQPYYISPSALQNAENSSVEQSANSQQARSDQPPAYFAMAGVCDQWPSPRGEMIMSFAIITTEASASIAYIHQRMPVMLQPTDWSAWLNPENHAIDPLTSMLRSSQQVQAWPVSLAVSAAGRNRRDAADLVQAI